MSPRLPAITAGAGFWRGVHGAALLLAVASAADARVRRHRLPDEFVSAKVVTEVVIVGYENRLVAKRVSDIVRIEIEYAHGKPDFRNNPESGRWPSAGSVVLLVVNEQNAVSFFGRREGAVWRFWDPYENKSRFECDSQKIAAVGKGLEDCLVPDDAMNRYLK